MRKSFLSGLAQVVGAPSLVFWLYLTSLVISLPLAVAMQEILREAIGPSQVAENLRQGFDLEWHGEFDYAHSGFADTFEPAVIGPLVVLDNLERLLDGRLLGGDKTVLAAGILFLLAWTFFAGGILDRFVHPDRPQSRARLFSHSGEYFFRFFRLLLISLLVYGAIFRWIANPLHAWLTDATRDVTVERTVIMYTALFYALVGLLLAFSAMVLDYARIAMVAEKRSSALLAVLRGLRFVLVNPGKTFGLYLALVVVAGLLMAVYGWLVPGVGQSTVRSIVLAFLVGQVYVVARIAMKLWFLASQTVLFRSAAGTPTEVVSSPGA